MNIFILITLLSFTDTGTADAIISTKDMSRAIRRHNTYVAINRKKAKKTCRKGSGNWCPQPWWNEVDENGEYKKPALGGNKSGNTQHKSQQHRWDTYTYSSKKNTWKKVYDSREIELANKFEKIDARAERMDKLSDEQIEELWNERTDDDIRNRRDKLIEDRSKLIKERDEIREKYGDILNRYGELNYRIADLDSEIYYLV